MVIPFMSNIISKCMASFSKPSKYVATSDISVAPVYFMVIENPGFPQLL